jgi:hypothetical protein
MTLHHWPNPKVPWRSFHNHWIVRLVEYLNQDVLPAGFQARPTEFIVGIEPDLLLLQMADQPEPFTGTAPFLAEATATAVLPAPADLPIVGIYSAYDTSRLVAIIEIVSPGNKDRAEAVQAFVEKVLFLLQDGVHVMVIDVISLPGESMRQPILERLGLEHSVQDVPGLWCASYCALPEDDPQPHLTVREWAEAVAVARPLPQLPLFLRLDQQWVMVDLQTTYAATLAAGRYQPGW